MGKSQLTLGLQVPDISHDQPNLAGYRGQLWRQGLASACAGYQRYGGADSFMNKSSSSK